MVRGCQSCALHLPSQPKEPYLAHDSPERPFQYIHADFFWFAGQQFLVVVDQLSSWPWVFDFGRSATTRKLIGAMCEVFCCSGVADVLFTDNGSQFTSNAFQAFLSRWKVQHTTSSPYYAQSNGTAEAAVKSVKKLIRSCWDFKNQCLDFEKWSSAMLQYRNTPSANGKSPAMCLYGHPVQDLLPAHRRAFDTAWQPPTQSAEAVAEARSEYAQTYYNASAQSLPVLSVGSEVAVQDPTTKLWSHHGTICDIGPHRRYFIRMANGKVMTRNRRFLRLRYGVVPTALSPDHADLPPAGRGQEPGSPAHHASVSPTLPRRSDRHRRRRARPPD